MLDQDAALASDLAVELDDQDVVTYVAVGDVQDVVGVDPDELYLDALAVVIDAAEPCRQPVGDASAEDVSVVGASYPGAVVEDASYLGAVAYVALDAYLEIGVSVDVLEP